MSVYLHKKAFLFCFLRAVTEILVPHQKSESTVTAFTAYFRLVFLKLHWVTLVKRFGCLDRKPANSAFQLKKIGNSSTSRTTLFIFGPYKKKTWSIFLTGLPAAPACWGYAGWWWCPGGRSPSVCWAVVWWSAGRGARGDTPAPRYASRPCKTADLSPTEASPEILAVPLALTASSLQGRRNRRQGHHEPNVWI